MGSAETSRLLGALFVVFLDKAKLEALKVINKSGVILLCHLLLLDLCHREINPVP